jgi:hypothetical protein
LLASCAAIAYETTAFERTELAQSTPGRGVRLRRG